MADDFVTVVTYSDPAEADAARNHLEAEGVRALLLDRETAPLAGQLTKAVGVIKLLVAVADEERAEAILENHVRRRAGLIPEPVPEESHAFVAEADKDKVEPLRDESATNDAENVPTRSIDLDEPPTARELDAERAYKAQIIAFLVWPVQLYALMCILTVAASSERLEGRYLRKYRFAIVLQVVLWMLALLALLFVSSRR